jgi:hypothetical protein
MAGDGKVHIVEPMSYRQIHALALQVVRKHNPQLLNDPSPFPVASFWEFDLQEHYGVVTGVGGLIPDGVEGLTTAEREDRRTTILVPEDVYGDLLDDQPRARFTVAHEVGHAILHAQQMHATGARPTMYRRSAVVAYRDPEWQANAFGAALLAPAPAVLTAVRRWGFDIDRLAAVFGMSTSAMDVRLRILRKEGAI